MENNLDDNVLPHINHDVKIFLVSGQVINFIAAWHKGLSQLLFDHEKYLKANNSNQSVYSYQMQNSEMTTNAYINLQFQSVTAIHCQRINK